jgi:hypothetical protein
MHVLGRAADGKTHQKHASRAIAITRTYRRLLRHGRRALTRARNLARNGDRPRSPTSASIMLPGNVSPPLDEPTSGLLMGALMPNGVRAANDLGTGTVAWGGGSTARSGSWARSWRSRSR